MRYNILQNRESIVSVKRKGNGNIRIFASIDLSREKQIKLLQEAIKYLKKK